MKTLKISNNEHEDLYNLKLKLNQRTLSETIRTLLNVYYHEQILKGLKDEKR